MKVRIRRFLRRYINGSKGMISLFLALVMTPFLSCSLILVESIRMQSTVETLAEIMDSSAFSTLASYDQFLEKRFALQAISQEQGINSTYNSYMVLADNMLDKDLTVTKNKATGQFPISDLDILKTQIVEAGESAGVVENLVTVSDLEELLKKLSGELGTEKIRNLSDATGKTAEAAKKEIEAFEKLDEIMKYYESDYKPARTAYYADLPKFWQAGEDYVKCCKELEEYEDSHAEEKYNPLPQEPDFGEMPPSPPSYPSAPGAEASEEEKKAYEEACNTLREGYEAELEDYRDRYSEWETEVYDPWYKLKTIYDGWKTRKESKDTAETEFNTAKSAAAKAAGTMADADQKIHGLINEYHTKVKEFGEKIDKAADALDKVETGNAAVDSMVDATGVLTDLVDQIAEVDNTFNTSYMDNIQREINDLRKQQTALLNLSAENVSNNESFENEYPVLPVSAIKEEDIQVIDGVRDHADNEAKKASENIGQAEEMLDFMGEILGLSILYDGSYDAVVEKSAFYGTYVNGANEATSTAIMACTMIAESITDFVKAAQDNPINGAIQLLASLAELLGAFVVFLEAVLTWSVESLVNLIGGLIHAGDFPDNYFMSCYCIYNLPNRLTVSKKNLYGEKFGTEKLMGYSTGGAASGILSDLENMVPYATANADGFRGAEAEYILCGTNNELYNQAGAFFNIYMLRMILTLTIVFTDAWVSMVSDPLGMWGIIPIIAIIITEPFLDTLFIVNDQAPPFFKGHCYATPMGAAFIPGKLVASSGLPNSVKKKLTDASKKLTSNLSESGDIPSRFDQFDPNVEYAEHLQILYLLELKQETILSRVRDLVNMEAKKKYEGKFKFDLDKSYTYVKAETTGTMNLMFGFERLSNTGKFNITKTRFIGY